MLRYARGPSNCHFLSRSSRGYTHILRQMASVSPGSTLGDRASHNNIQHSKFNDPKIVSQFVQPLPDDILQRLHRIASVVPGLGSSSRVVDVGSGTGCLIPHLKARGLVDILAVDLSEGMLAEISKKYPSPGGLGNSLGVRTWCGDVMDLPNFLGPADAFFFNGVFGNLHSPRDALLKAALLMRPGGSVVVSHPMGRAWHSRLHAEDPAHVPHPLPQSREAFDQIIHDLPLRLVDFVDEPDCYLAHLQVPQRYALPRGPLYLDGPVVTGFGRGSRQMGVPTANIDPLPLAGILKDLPNGVYFGWARLEAPSGWPQKDGEVHKMVMNVGRRPTVSGEGESSVSVEVHVIDHKFSDDFYGQRLRVVALGYLRPEMKFPGGIVELITRIRADIAISRSQLDDPELATFNSDRRFY